MGNQGHSSDEARRACEWMQAGAIGDVKEVHVWTNRPLVSAPGLPRPAALVDDRASWLGRRAIDRRLADAMGNYAAPSGLNWNLFLGVAPTVPYHPIYHPFNWRGWADWGRAHSATWART